MDDRILLDLLIESRRPAMAISAAVDDSTRLAFAIVTVILSPLSMLLTIFPSLVIIVTPRPTSSLAVSTCIPTTALLYTTKSRKPSSCRGTLRRFSRNNCLLAEET